MDAALLSTLTTALSLQGLERCAVCARSLSDAASVELGIGPVCRKHGGYDLQSIVESLRPLANAAVRAIARDLSPAGVLPLLHILRSLGFDKLEARISQRLAAVTILPEEGSNGERYTVTHRADSATHQAFSAIPGRMPGAKKGSHSIPVSEKATICAVLHQHLEGQLLLGCKGLTMVKLGYRIPTNLDLATLEQMAATLCRSLKPACQAHGAVLLKVVNGEAAAELQPDWRPQVPLAEDYYAA